MNNINSVSVFAGEAHLAIWLMPRSPKGLEMELPHGELGLTVYPGSSGEKKLVVFVNGPVGKVLRIDKNGTVGVATEIPVR